MALPKQPTARVLGGDLFFFEDLLPEPSGKLEAGASGRLVRLRLGCRSRQDESASGACSPSPANNGAFEAEAGEGGCRQKAEQRDGVVPDVDSHSKRLQ